MYSKLKNTHASAAKVCFGCRCAGLFKLVRVFMLLAVTLLGFGLLTGIWMAVTAELSNTSPYAVTHTQIHKGVFNHTHPPRHTHTFRAKGAKFRCSHARAPLSTQKPDLMGLRLDEV